MKAILSVGFTSIQSLPAAVVSDTTRADLRLHHLPIFTTGQDYESDEHDMER